MINYYTLFDDDIYDTTLNAESTKRIQYQYRFRTVNNFAVDTYQDGFSDTTNVKAQGTNGSPTSYSFSASSTDNGLWIAGSGNQASATALGTVDGYVYGLPICLSPYSIIIFKSDADKGFLVLLIEYLELTPLLINSFNGVTFTGLTASNTYGLPDLKKITPT